MIASSMLFDIRLCEGDHCADDVVEWIQDVQVDSWAMYKRKNFTDRVGEPTFLAGDIYDSQVLVGELDANGSPSKVNVNQVYLRENDVATWDRYVNLQPTWESVFFDVNKQIYKPVAAINGNKDYEKLLYRSQYFKAAEKVSYQREAYGLLDLLGDLGGVTEIIMIIFGLALYPVSAHSFYVHAAKLFYFAKTDDL